MKFLFGILVFIMINLQSTIAAPSQFISHDAHKRYIIQFKKEFNAKYIADHFNHLTTKTIQYLPNIHAVSIQLTEKQLSLWQNQQSVQYIEPDQLRFLQADQQDYGISLIQADQLSDLHAANQKICIVDTGYDLQHEDLSDGPHITGETSNTLLESYTLGPWHEDSYGHGTHLSGIISALNNNIGLEGINPSGLIQLHHVKIIHNPNYWPIWGSDLIAAVHRCQQADSNIINLSIAGQNPSVLEEQALNAAYEEGLLIFAAAGNRGSNDYFYPAAYSNIIAVGAVDAQQTAWQFTQSNDQVELVAPGVGILSTLPDQHYGRWDGTSVATAFASGTAALIWSHFPDCSHEQVRSALTTTAKDLGQSNYDFTYGFGLIQAKHAFEQLEQLRCEQQEIQLFTNQDLFLQQTMVNTLENFETWPVSHVLFNYHHLGIHWTSPFNLAASPAGLANIGPNTPTTSTVLTANGLEHFILTFDQPTSAVGFDVYLNQFGPATIQVTFADDQIETFEYDGAFTEISFWGIRSLNPVKVITFTTPGGQIINTALDNIHFVR